MDTAPTNLYIRIFMAKVYLVHHPIEEPVYQYSKDGSPSYAKQMIPWNCKKHTRKLFRHDGIYMNDVKGNFDYAPLYFWGEYEPYSCAHVFPKDKPAIHDDLKSARNFFPTSIPYMLNTDPYVFGARFKYICCQKNKKSTMLNPGDIVIFGNADNKTNRFYFDTVFVCKEDGVNVPVEDFENQYYMASVRNTGIQQYAEGIMYNDREEHFSFVPCRVGRWDTDDVEEGMIFKYKDLPYLKYIDIGLNKINVRRKVNVSVESIKIWNHIVSAVKERNFAFGIHLAEI